MNYLSWEKFAIILEMLILFYYSEPSENITFKHFLLSFFSVRKCLKLILWILFSA